MMQGNQTMAAYFILTGISDAPGLQTPIFLLVFLIYIMTLGGNSTIFLLVCLDTHLHTPMYFFLANLAILDMSSSTVTLHKVLLVYISGDNTVSVPTCICQIYVFISLTGAELLLLTAMSYDRYVAICNPLHYPVVMNHRICSLLATVCWLMGFLEITPNLFMISNFSCYISNEMNHYFCDMAALLKLTCSDTIILKLYIFTMGGLLGFLTPFLLTLTSYIYIISTILKIRTSSGRRKAFYTCSSHLTVVVLLYLSLYIQYLPPTSMGGLDYSKLFSLFNTAAVPALNPLVYSLKNKDVKLALRRKLACFQPKVNF